MDSFLIATNGKCFVCIDQSRNSATELPLHRLALALQISFKELLKNTNEPILERIGFDTMSNLKVILCNSCFTDLRQLSTAEEGQVQKKLAVEKLTFDLSTIDKSNAELSQIYSNLSTAYKDLAEQEGTVKEARKRFHKRVAQLLAKNISYFDTERITTLLQVYLMESFVYKLRLEFTKQCGSILECVTIPSNSESCSSVTPGPSSATSRIQSGTGGMIVEESSAGNDNSGCASKNISKSSGSFRKRKAEQSDKKGSNSKDQRFQDSFKEGSPNQTKMDSNGSSSNKISHTVPKALQGNHSSRTIAPRSSQLGLLGNHKHNPVNNNLQRASMHLNHSLQLTSLNTRSPPPPVYTACAMPLSTTEGLPHTATKQNWPENE